MRSEKTMKVTREEVVKALREEIANTKPEEELIWKRIHWTSRHEAEDVK